MQISDLLRIMRQLIDLQEKKKREKKKNIWYRLENPTGTLGSYLGKKKWGVARESNRGLEAQISASNHWDTEEFRSKGVKEEWKVNFKRPKVPVLLIHPVP